MTNIFQQIWDADQSGAGVKPILDTDSGDRTVGFVKVNSNLNAPDTDLRVLPEVVIPDTKRRTYDLCRLLFDNYALPEQDEEVETPEEREEVHDLVHAMVDTAPMQVAREYVGQATGASVTRERWYNTIMDMWFRRYSMGGDPHLSGFEHEVIVGKWLWGTKGVAKGADVYGRNQMERGLPYVDPSRAHCSARARLHRDSQTGLAQGLQPLYRPDLETSDQRSQTQALALQDFQLHSVCPSYRHPMATAQTESQRITLVQCL